MSRQYWISGLVGLSGILLGVLVPGGPIETRSFSHINPFVLGAFNTFLTTLVITSLLISYFVLSSKRWAMMVAGVCGFSFLAVYGLDLATVFPVSPDPMPPALLAIEVIGTILSFPLITLPLQALYKLESAGFTTINPLHQEQPPSLLTLQDIVIVLILGIGAVGIITFATKSAMGF